MFLSVFICLYQLNLIEFHNVFNLNHMLLMICAGYCLDSVNTRPTRRCAFRTAARLAPLPPSPLLVCGQTPTLHYSSAAVSPPLRLTLVLLLTVTHCFSRLASSNRYRATGTAQLRSVGLRRGHFVDRGRGWRLGADVACVRLSSVGRCA